MFVHGAAEIKLSHGPRRPTLFACQNRCMGSIRLSATLVPRGPAAAVVLDDEQVAAVGEGAKRFPVVATVNGHTWRTTAPREVELPEAFAKALADDSVARAAFESLAYTH